MVKNHGFRLRFSQQNQSIDLPIGSMYAIYGNMDPINIPPISPFMLAYIPYMDPMG